MLMRGYEMVKKIKVKQKSGKPKIGWKAIIAILAVLGLIALIMMMIGQAGLKSGG